MNKILKMLAALISGMCIGSCALQGGNILERRAEFEPTNFCATVTLKESNVFAPLEACALSLEECITRVQELNRPTLRTIGVDKEVGNCKPVTELWCYSFKYAKNMERQFWCSLTPAQCKFNTDRMQEITAFVTPCRKFPNDE